MRRHRFDNLMTGILLGAIYPILAYVVVEQVFAWLAMADLVADVSDDGVGDARRERTTYLFALVAAIIPLQIFSNRRWGETIRGFMLPMFVYIAAWIWKYGSYLMAHF